MNKLSFKYVVRQLIFVGFVLLVACIIFAIGLTIGYGTVGGADNAWAILSPGKWQSIFDKFMAR